MKSLFAVIFMASTLLISCKQDHDNFRRISFPPDLRTDLEEYVASIELDSLHDLRPSVTVTRVAEDLYKVNLVYTPDRPIRQNDWRVRIKPAFKPSFHWAPHLTPGPREHHCPACVPLTGFDHCRLNQAADYCA